MKKYEVVYQIFNPCSGDQTAKVDIQEAFIDDLDLYVKRKFNKIPLEYEKEETSDGVTVYHIKAGGMLEKMTFTVI